MNREKERAAQSKEALESVQRMQEFQNLRPGLSGLSIKAMAIILAILVTGMVLNFLGIG